MQELHQQKCQDSHAALQARRQSRLASPQVRGMRCCLTLSRRTPPLRGQVCSC